jgi:class 3 adenylate cyclase
MFTDIEGSTRLASGLGAEPYRVVLHRHRALIREVLRYRRGTEIETEGDSFFVVFDDAARAAEAALEIQTALRIAHWPDLGLGKGPIRPRVRMGLHTGEAWPSAGGYATPEVHRTARICAAAHGDQILASAQLASHWNGSATSNCEGCPAPPNWSSSKPPACPASSRRRRSGRTGTTCRPTSRPRSTGPRNTANWTGPSKATDSSPSPASTDAARPL